MLMAIIEFEVHAGHEKEAGSLMERVFPHLETIDGYLGSDAATSVLQEGLRYEISYWRDSASLERWSKHPEHERVKDAGKNRLFKWYRIRVGQVERDWEEGAVPAHRHTAGQAVPSAS